MRKHIPNILSIITIIMTVTACNKLYDVSLANSANTKSQIEGNEQQQYPRPASVVEENAAYVDVTPVSLNQPPSWYSTPITLHGNKLPFNFYIAQILGSSRGILVNYDPTVDPNRLISLDYSGTAVGALNALANKGNYYFEYDRKARQLNWSTLETKIFDISFMPGSSQYQLGQSGSSGLSSSSGGSSGGSSGSSSGGSSGSATGYDFTQDSQFSNLTGTVSIWDDLSKTIQNLLSKDGTVTISQSTTTVTVHDHPANVKAIGDYIYKMNEEMSRQVRIYVQVLAVALSKDYSEGINWDLVRLSGNNSFTLQSPSATNAAAGVSSAAAPMTLNWAVSSTSSSPWAGTNSFIQALQEQGTVSKITEPVVTTLNNQVATISLQTQQAYVSGTSGGTVSGNVASLPSPTISEIVTGFNLYLLPKIQGQSIYLQVSTVLSDLISLNTYNAATGETNGGSGSSAASGSGSGSGSTGSATVIQTPQTVQEPTVDYRSFNQRTMVPNGATLIMAGFKQNTNRAEQNKLFNSAALGGTGASTNTQEVLVLITPVILSTTGNGTNSGKVN